MSKIIAYVGLSSNLEDPINQVKTALRELALLPESRLTAQSGLYLNPPMGPPDQPDYINAVAELETSLEAEDLLSHLQHIEELHHRRRIIHWGPRTIDCDILLYGQSVINSDRLKVPHPGLAQRLFVVKPLLEIAPNIVVPGVDSLIEILEELEEESTIESIEK